MKNINSVKKREKNGIMSDIHDIGGDFDEDLKMRKRLNQDQTDLKK